MGATLPFSELERMAGELKCPICLSLYKHAASLSCNHCFCTSCIVQSIKRISCCPICKVPATPREVRSAPQMDSLVTIFKGMETSAGVSLFHTQQPCQLKSFELGGNLSKQNEIKRKKTPKGRGKMKQVQISNAPLSETTDISHRPKKCRRGKSELVPPDSSVQGAGHVVGSLVGSSVMENEFDLPFDSCVPAKKKVRATPSPVLTVNPGSIEQSEIKYLSSEPPTRTSSFHMVNLVLPEAAEEEINTTSSFQTANPVFPDDGDEVSLSPIGKQGSGEGKSFNLNNEGPSFQKKGDQDIHGAHIPHHDESGLQRPQLSPFFWLRDRTLPSQDELPTQPTQPTQATQTQGAAHPLRPSFSDLKGSDDDDQSEDVQHPVFLEYFSLFPSAPAKPSTINSRQFRSSSSPFTNRTQQTPRYDQYEIAGNEVPDTDSCGSDAFLWSQRPCSPELSSSPVKKFDQPLHFEHNSFNDQEPLLGKGENSRNEVEDDRGLSPLKCLIEAPVEVEATQTPQLHQEPSRMIRGTLLKCSNLQSLDSGHQPSSKVCRRLKSNDASSLLSEDDYKSKIVGPKKAARTKAQNHEKVVSPDPSCEEVRLEIYLASSSHDVPMDLTAKETIERHCPDQGLYSRDAMSESQQNGTNGGECGTADDVSKDGPGCVFCGSADDSEVAGPLVEYEDAFPSRRQTRVKAVHVHKLCAEWAPDVYFDEDEPKNLACEINRGQKMKCTSCGMRGAALGCCNKRCKKSFHYPCGRATPGCKWDEDDFVMFCPQHADCEFPRRKRCRVSPVKGADLPTTEKGRIEKNATQGASPGEGRQRWPISPACKWVLCGSGLDPEMKRQLAAFASVTGASVVKRWSPSVTHVITGTDEQGGARRTLKFLMAMLKGKWIVKTEWMNACLSASHIVGEDQYEVTSDTNGFVGGPQRSRALAKIRAPKLLEGLSFHFFGEFLSVSKEDLQSLVVAGRGMVLQRKPLPLETSHSNSTATKPEAGDTIVLYNEEDDVKMTAAVVEEAKSLAIHARAYALPHTWLLNSVAAYELLPVQKLCPQRY